MQQVLKRNLELIRLKVGLESSQFESFMASADLQNSSLLGLGKRMELCILEKEVAVSLKDKLKARIEKTFEEHMNEAKSYELDLLL